ncbi:unnamed protein product, partial [Brenthis ino]
MRDADRALKHAYAPPSVSTPAATRRETRPSTNTGNQRKKMSAVYNVTEAEEEQVSQCPSCEQTHALPQCPKYKGLSLDERWELVKEKKLCFKCITKKHRRSNCKAKLCGVNECRSPHHPTLHREEKTPKPLINETEAVLSVATKATVSTQAVLLKMCPVTVVGPRGEEKTYALMDEGATITLIDEELAKKIGAKGPLTPLHMHGVNMTQHEEDSQLVTVHLEGKDGKRHKLRARTIKNMKLHQQSIPSALLKQEHLRDLPKEEVCYDQAHPGILVGTDHWEYIVSRELRVGGPNQPAASRTQLGWVVHGTAPRSVIHNQDGVLHVFTVEPGGGLKKQQDQRLHDLVEEHFRIDALGIAHKSRVSEVNSQATKIVEQTLKKVEGGYQVGLPWKQDDIKMPPSFDTALRRLTKIEQKMDAAPAFAKEYTKQIENLLAKGYAVPCNGTERSSKPEELWPVDERSTEDEEVLLHVTTEDQQGDEWLPDPARFSKFETLVRAAARVLVFVDKCRRRATGLEHRHIEEAERALIRRAQKDSFREELLRMKASHPLPKASRLFRLDPVLEEGILRV